MNDFKEIIVELHKLPRISDKAVDAFHHSLPRIVFLVNEKFVVDNKFCCIKSVAAQMELLGNIQKKFGDTLRAAYRFHLYEALIEEFGWLISTLHYRGIAEECFAKMIGTWLMTIHGIVEPTFSRELVTPLQILERNLPIFIKQAEVNLGPEDEKQDKLLHLLLKKKRREAADYVMSLAKMGGHPDDLCVELLAPVLKKIGLLWQRNEISAADEHVVTELCRYIMFRLYDSVPIKQTLPYKALVSCVPGEEHALGAEMVANYLADKGWTVYFLGHSSPENDLVEALTNYQPDSIFLSISLISNLPVTFELLKKVRKIVPAIKIIIGGNAISKTREIFADLVDATVEDIRDLYKTSIKLLGKNA